MCRHRSSSLHPKPWLVVLGVFTNKVTMLKPIFNQFLKSSRKATKNFSFFENMGSKCNIWLKKINAILASASWELALASSTSGLVNIPEKNYKNMTKILTVLSENNTKTDINCTSKVISLDWSLVQALARASSSYETALACCYVVNVFHCNAVVTCKI